MFGWLKKTDDRSFGAERSSKWPKVRAEHLQRNPECIACGRRDKLEVHHCVPFHIAPDRELDPTNLVSVCATPCHLVHGHYLSWLRYNPEVVADCKRYRAGLEKAKAAAS
jgi:5-methylcytosine-specific restriction endonuclease McrA